MIDVSVETTRPMEPGSGADEYASQKPFRAVITVRSTVIRRNFIIPVRTNGRPFNSDSNLRAWVAASYGRPGGKSQKGKVSPRVHMSTEQNVQTVKDFFAAVFGGDREAMLALVAEDIEWIIPGEDWPLAGTRRGHAGLADLLQKANETVDTSFPEPPEFIAQEDRVLVVGFARGRIKATNRKFEDHWVFAITVRNGKVTNIREYVDTQALARASETAASPRP